MNVNNIITANSLPQIISVNTAVATEAVTKSHNHHQDALKLLDAIEIVPESPSLEACKKSAEKITQALENSHLASNSKVVQSLNSASAALNEVIAESQDEDNFEIDSAETIESIDKAAVSIDVARIHYADRWQKGTQEFINAIASRDCAAAKKLMDEGISRPDLVALRLEEPWVYHDLEEPITVVSALGYACLSESVDMVRLLMQYGADPNIRGVAPAWLIVLCSAMPMKTKIEMWNAFNGRANVMLLKNWSERYLSKAFGCFHVRRCDLHMVLSSMENLREKTNAAHTDTYENLCLGILDSTLNPGTSLWYSGDDPKVTQAHKSHAIRLGAVMICHGLIGRPNMSDLPEHFNEKADFNGKLYSLADVLKLRQEIEMRMDYYVEALLQTQMDQKTMPTVQWKIVLQYLEYSPDARNGVIAGECMKILFCKSEK